MKHRPTFSAKTLYHLISRSNCQRNHQQERRDAKQNERPLHYVGGDAEEIEEPIEPNVGQQVQCSVEKSEQPQHASKLDEGIDAEDLPERRDREGETQKNQRQHSRCSGRKLQRVWSHTLPVNVPHEQCQGNERIDENDEFGKGHVRTQKYFTK